MDNINHKNFFKEEKSEAPVMEAPVVEAKEAPVVEAPNAEDIVEEIVEVAKKEKVSEEKIYKLTKKEQIDMLEENGFSYEDIKKLKKEADRVDALYTILND